LTEKAYVVFLKKRKNRVGAVVQLTREGNEELIDKGKVVLQKKLSKGLKEVIEKVAWPRYWRFVYEMPINQQGKITFSTLQELFDEESKLKFPDFLSQEFDENTQEYVIEFILPQNLFYFKGHFQGRPVLPGFVQISWAIHYAQELFGELGTFVRLEAIKFQQVIQPREKIKLKLRWEEEKHRLFFGYSNKNNTNSMGRVVFKEET
jgi:3-hydroxymyristoyl/3-hydroxydecanoyl-(acyl carrier protein) dehydratase